MKDDGFLEFVLDQLDGLGRVSSRRMFGAAGIYRDDVFFAVVADGRLYFKVDDESRGDFEREGMKAFRPTPDQVLKTYYEVPIDVLEDAGALCEWARRAVAAQVRTTSAKGKGKHKSRGKAKRKKKK